MLEMRPGRPEEVPAQKALWKAAFGDEDRYIDWFYECCGASADVLEVVEEGRLASMLALLPQTLTLPGGGTASGWYIYALATDPGARSKGYGRQLLRFVDGYLAERGADCVTTVPAEPSLFKFFGTVGFAPCFSTRKLELLKSMLQPAAEGDRAEPVEPGEYNTIRRRLRGPDRNRIKKSCRNTSPNNIRFYAPQNRFTASSAASTTSRPPLRTASRSGRPRKTPVRSRPKASP